MYQVDLKGKVGLDVVKGGHYSLPAGALEALANDPDVAYISLDRPVKGMLDYTEPAVNAAIALQYGWDGAGIGVAVIDSGIANSPDLPLKRSATFNPNSVSTQDYYGHGTHVGGIVAGSGAISAGKFMGVAPGVNLQSA